MHKSLVLLVNIIVLDTAKRFKMWYKLQFKSQMYFIFFRLQDYGYYADMENECQVFHVCVPNEDDGTVRRFSYICPVGLVFSQVKWFHNFFIQLKLKSMNFILNQNSPKVFLTAFQSASFSKISECILHYCQYTVKYVFFHH